MFAGVFISTVTMTVMLWIVRKKVVFVTVVLLLTTCFLVFRVLARSGYDVVTSNFANNVITNKVHLEKDKAQNQNVAHKRLTEKNDNVDFEHHVKPKSEKQKGTKLQSTMKPNKTTKLLKGKVQRTERKKTPRPNMPILPPKYLLMPTNKSLPVTRLVLMTTWKENKEKLFIHENVLRTWKLWMPTVKPFMFTNDSMLMSRAKKNDWKVLPLKSLTCGEMPIMRDMYLQAMANTDSVFYAFTNGDILLSEEIKNTVKVLSEMELAQVKPVMLLASRTNVNFSEGPNLEDVSQVAQLKAKGWPLTDGSSDVFITNRLFPWEFVPDVVIGRLGIGMWIVSYAREMNVTVIDISKTATAIHMTTKAGNYESHWKPHSKCNHEIYRKLNILPPSWRCGHIQCAAMETSYGRQDGKIYLTGRNRFKYDPLCMQCSMNLTSIVFG